MSMGLTSTNKTNVTSVLTAMTAAIDGFDPADRAALGIRALLNKQRTELLELAKNERAQ